MAVYLYLVILELNFKEMFAIVLCIMVNGAQSDFNIRCSYVMQRIDNHTRDIHVKIWSRELFQGNWSSIRDYYKLGGRGTPMLKHRGCGVQVDQLTVTLDMCPNLVNKMSHSPPPKKKVKKCEKQ